MYFSNCKALHAATNVPHYLLQLLQISRTQATVKELTVTIDEEEVLLYSNRSYCAGVKMCAKDNCDYTVSNKKRINHCKITQNLHYPTQVYVAVTWFTYTPNSQRYRWKAVVHSI